MFALAKIEDRPSTTPGILPLKLEQSVLTIYSPADTVVDIGWIIRGFGQLDSPRKELVEIDGSADQSNHVLAGDIMAPENNAPLTELISNFVLDGQAGDQTAAVFNTFLLISR